MERIMSGEDSVEKIVVASRHERDIRAQLTIIQRMFQVVLILPDREEHTQRSNFTPFPITIAGPAKNVQECHEFIQNFNGKHWESISYSPKSQDFIGNSLFLHYFQKMFLTAIKMKERGHLHIVGMHEIRVKQAASAMKAYLEEVKNADENHVAYEMFLAKVPESLKSQAGHFLKCPTAALMIICNWIDLVTRKATRKELDSEFENKPSSSSQLPKPSSSSQLPKPSTSSQKIEELKRGKRKLSKEKLSPSKKSNVLRSSKPKKLRHIIIDGSNVAFSHGRNKVFSSKGIELAIAFFAARGHQNITAFVPQKRRDKKRSDTIDQRILEKLFKKGRITFTPSREKQGRTVSAYDDRFLFNLAEETGGVIVSNDQFADLRKEKETWRKIIDSRIIGFCFVGNKFMIPEDPYGKGSNLTSILSFGSDSE